MVWQEGGSGAPRSGCHHFGVTPYYEVKPYLYRFVAKILFPSSFELKTNQFSRKDFYLVLEFTYLCAEKTHYFDGNDIFLSSLVFGPKRGDTTKFRPGATIPSNATVAQYLYSYHWYSYYMPSSGTVSISK